MSKTVEIICHDVRTNIESGTDAHNGTNRENTVMFCQWIRVFMISLKMNSYYVDKIYP